MLRLKLNHANFRPRPLAYTALQWQIAASATFEIFHFIIFNEHVYQQLTNDPISAQKSLAVPEIRVGKKL